MRKERERMWQWLQKNHPIIYEAIWWGVNLMAIASIIISIICIVNKG